MPNPLITIEYVSPVLQVHEQRFLACTGFLEDNVFDATNQTICGVAGELSTPAGAPVPFQVFGTTVKFQYKVTGVNSSPLRWYVVFQLPTTAPGNADYSLTIRGLQYEAVANPIETTVSPIAVPGLLGRIREALTIGAPPAGSLPVAEAKAFAASGSLGSKPLASATMTNTSVPGSPPVAAEYMSSENGVWAAVFPPLAPSANGTPIPYTLTVTDTGGTIATNPYIFDK